FRFSLLERRPFSAAPCSWKKQLLNISQPSVRIKGQADIILREDLRCCPRTGDVIQLRQLPAVVEAVFAVETVEHGSHPPRKALGLPDAPLRDLRIASQK